MKPTNEFGLAEAPPLTPDVADSALHRVLAEMDTPAPAADRRPRRWAPLLTAAAAVLVAIGVATAITLSAAPGPTTPATAPAEPTLTPDPTTQPLRPDQLPPPAGAPEFDTALARCATAVVRSDRAAEFPPPPAWTLGVSGFQTLRSELVIDDAFACLVTVDRVAVSGTSGTPVDGVQVVRMSPTDLVVLDPDERGFEITAGGHQNAWGAPVTFVALDSTSTEQVRISVGGGPDVPLPEPAEALVVTDRTLPTQDPDEPGASDLAECIARRSTDTPADQSRWTLIGRHDIGASAPTALIARIDGVAAGVCVPELDGLGQEFVDAPLRPPTDDVQVIQYAPGRRTTVLLAMVPPGVTRVRMAPTEQPADGQDCTIVDGLAVCTLDLGGGPGPRIVLTAFTAEDAGGREVYRN